MLCHINCDSNDAKLKEAALLRDKHTFRVMCLDSRTQSSSLPAAEFTVTTHWGLLAEQKQKRITYIMFYTPPPQKKKKKKKTRGTTCAKTWTCRYSSEPASLTGMFYSPFLPILYWGTSRFPIYIYKTVVSDRVLTLYQPCAYPGAVLRHASGPTGPRSSESFFVDQILAPRIVKLTVLQIANQTLTLINPT